MSNSSSYIIKRIVNHQVIWQLVQFWLKIAAENQGQVITESSLLNLANINYQINDIQQLETESFFLLKTAKLNAFLQFDSIVKQHKYHLAITFEPMVIIQELTQLAHLKKWQSNVIKYIQTDFQSKLNFTNDNSSEFIIKVMNILINAVEKQPESNYIFTPSPPMDKLLHYQVEQERIFEQIKIQISQNLHLSQIIQTAINQSLDFLDLDRLLIYQFDLPLQPDFMAESISQIDTVTYEAKQEHLASTLYFQEKECFPGLRLNKSKYSQGFSLVINDVQQDLSLNPCLESLIATFEVKAKALVPINVQGKLWGLIIAHQCRSTRQWQHQEIKFIRQIAEYLAIAIYHHQSYQQLQQQKNLLEKQVQAQAQQIKDALIAAEAASKSKHEFLGSMSHELRTPLTCVIGLSSTLLQWSSTKSTVPLSPEKQQQYLHLIQQSGKHLLAMINNILEFSDVESGKHLLNVQQISSVEVARQSIQMLQANAAEKKIALILDIKLKIDEEYFWADEIRLKEILFNLIDNGIKFTPENGEVIVRIWREQRQIIFQVEDNGIGIPPQEIPSLFEKFKQIENFKHRTHGGTGLGLALTKKLIELHGGTIEVESDLEQGSLFTVYLPIKNPVEPHLTDESSITETLTSSPIIMLVTEDEESAIFICQLLNTIDCKVVWLMDSAMAINQIELLQPRLIIIDLDFEAREINHIDSAIKQSSLANKTNIIGLDNCDCHQGACLCKTKLQETNLEVNLNSDDLANQNQTAIRREDQELSSYKVDGYLSKAMSPTQIINKINSFLNQNLKINL